MGDGGNPGICPSAFDLTLAIIAIDINFKFFFVKSLIIPKNETSSPIQFLGLIKCKFGNYFPFLILFF